ncbi:MAG TPA: hypothetical protein PLL53_21750, partial [Saprospiraceae bacterium]|nr:hypothetical protein [Saprospiraceae bacterium]
TEGLGFVVEYRETPTTRVVPCDQDLGIFFWERGGVMMDLASFSGANLQTAAGVTSIAPSAVGVGGSMARFTIAASK